MNGKNFKIHKKGPLIYAKTTQMGVRFQHVQNATDCYSSKWESKHSFALYHKCHLYAHQYKDAARSN